MIRGIAAMAGKMDNQNDAGVLTPREREVVALIAEGLTNRGIGNRLGTSGNTVRNQLWVAYKKMGVGNRAGAVVWWMENKGQVTGNRETKEQETNKERKQN